jgi:hypothetical protein
MKSNFVWYDTTGLFCGPPGGSSVWLFGDLDRSLGKSFPEPEKKFQYVPKGQVYTFTDMSLRVIGASREDELLALDQVRVSILVGDRPQGTYPGSALVETNPARLMFPVQAPPRQSWLVLAVNYSDQPISLRVLLRGYKSEAREP